MIRAVRAACAAAIFTGVSLAAPLAWADTNNAETLFQEGLAAMKRNDFVIACEAFDKSNRQDASPGTQINLAICYEKQKKWASAWTWYRSAAGLAQQRSQTQREQSANDSAKRLEPQLHYVTISVKNAPADTVVKRDGAEITVSLGGKDVALPFDMGEHVIEVKATGKKTVTKTITTAETGTPSDKPEVIAITLEDAPVEQALDTSGPGGKNTTIIRTENDGSTQRTIGLVVGGAGILAGLAAGGVFILAKNEAGDRDDQQAIFNNPQRSTVERNNAGVSANSHNDAANNNQLLSLILTGGAVVMVGLGAVLYFTAGSKAKEKTAIKVVPTPIAGPNFQGLGLVGRF